MCAVGEEANFRRVAALSNHRRKLVESLEGSDMYKYYPSFCVKANRRSFGLVQYTFKLASLKARIQGCSVSREGPDTIFPVRALHEIQELAWN